MNKKTVVIGGSPNPERYSFKATSKLKEYGFEAIPIGLKEGKINDTTILTGMPKIEDVHTITLYISSANQPPYYDYIFSLHPKRIIFNPGTENPAFFKQVQSKGIEAVEACTLVMLSVGSY